MGAQVDHQFERGFLLDEECLRKLHEIISSRLAKLPTPPALIYTVVRGDSMSFDTESTDVVVGEDNDDWRAITRLELKAAVPDVFDFRLWLSSKRGCMLQISGDDRDSVFLLFSDLRDYTQTNMLASRFASDQFLAFASLSVICGAMGLLVLAAILTAGEPAGIGEALASGNLTDKLDFLIRRQERSGRVADIAPILVAASALFCFMPFVVDGSLLRKVVNQIFPANLFLFGKQKRRFARRRQIVQNILWVVVIGGLVSTVTGYAVFYATSP